MGTTALECRDVSEQGISPYLLLTGCRLHGGLGHRGVGLLQCNCSEDSLAAVGVDNVSEELHAHDGEGVVEDDEREAQAGHAGEELEHGVQHVAVALLDLEQPAITFSLADVFFIQSDVQ